MRRLKIILLNNYREYITFEYYNSICCPICGRYYSKAWIYRHMDIVHGLKAIRILDVDGEENKLDEYIGEEEVE